MPKSSHERWREVKGVEGTSFLGKPDWRIPTTKTTMATRTTNIVDVTGEEGASLAMTMTMATT